MKTKLKYTGNKTIVLGFAAVIERDGKTVRQRTPECKPGDLVTPMDPAAAAELLDPDRVDWEPADTTEPKKKAAPANKG